MDLLEALAMGARHSYGQVKDDLGALLSGSYNPGTAGRMIDVLGEMPLGRVLGKMGQMPIVKNIAHGGGRRFHGTPYVFNEAEKAKGGLAGPGLYLTSEPGVADSYAKGSTFQGANKFDTGPDALQRTMETQMMVEKSWPKEIARQREMGNSAQAGDLEKQFAEILATMPKLGPNIHSYQLKPHETFNMDALLNKGDMKKLQAYVDQAKHFTPDQRADLLGVLSSVQPENTGADLMLGLDLALKPLTSSGDKPLVGSENYSLVNRLLKDAGFGSVSYDGGKRMGLATGGPQHLAEALLDLSLIEPYVDYLTRTGAQAQKMPSKLVSGNRLKHP